MKPAPDAKTIAAERMAKIAQQQERLRELSPQLVEDAKNFKEKFGCCIVRNVRPR